MAELGNDSFGGSNEFLERLCHRLAVNREPRAERDLEGCALQQRGDPFPMNLPEAIDLGAIYTEETAG